MYFSSKFPTGRALLAALVVILWVFGGSALHAKTEHQQQTCGTCPVDPKKVAHEQHEAEEQAARDQKAAEHAQHEAAEACERNQKGLKHAEHEAEEARAKAEAKEADVSKLQGSMCCAAPTVAEVKSEPEVVMSKPTPPPEIEVAPPVIIITPPPAPEPEKPKELPRTASPMDLIGLIGLVSMSGSLAGFLRRK
jgi:hypothetical protein